MPFLDSLTLPRTAFALAGISCLALGWVGVGALGFSTLLLGLETVLAHQSKAARGYAEALAAERERTNAMEARVTETLAEYRNELKKVAAVAGARLGTKG